MKQIARNLTMDEWGILKPGQYLIHDGDKKFCPAFKYIIDDSGVERVPLPPRSPNLNAIAERFVRSVKEEAVSRFILFGENSLRYVLKEYLMHYHAERCHQGLGNGIPLPANHAANDREGPIQCHERLGGALKFYNRKAA
jgi:putative transposase